MPPSSVPCPALRDPFSGAKRRLPFGIVSFVPFCKKFLIQRSGKTDPTAPLKFHSPSLEQKATKRTKISIPSASSLITLVSARSPHPLSRPSLFFASLR